MLRNKRAYLTAAEFQVWMNRHHARTDPYSYTGDIAKGSDAAPKWNPGTSVIYKKSAGVLHKSHRVASSRKKYKPVSTVNNRYTFYVMNKRVTPDCVKWMNTLRQYS